MSAAESTPDLENQKKRWEKYRAELTAHYEGEIDAAKKLYATFVPVFFAVSLAFLKDIVNWPEADYKWLVYTSWGCFIAVITLTLVSYLVSAEVAIKQFNLYNSFFNATGKLLSLEDGTKDYQTCQRLKRWSDRGLFWNRITSACLFFAALVLLIVFIGLNNTKEGGHHGQVPHGVPWSRSHLNP